MKNEKGRSMVEMLGVLAIVGVLSAGALKGYSAAMFKHKMNQTVDIYSQILQRLYQLDQTGEVISMGGRGDGPQDFVKYGLLDECQEVDEEFCRLPLGEIRMGLDIGSTSDAGWIDVQFSSAKECISFASMHWENVVPIDWMYNGGVITISDEAFIFYPMRNDKEITMQEIIQACQKYCQRDGSCYYNLNIRGY